MFSLDLQIVLIFNAQNSRAILLSLCLLLAWMLILAEFLYGMPLLAVDAFSYIFVASMINFMHESNLKQIKASFAHREI